MALEEGNEGCGKLRGLMYAEREERGASTGVIPNPTKGALLLT